MINSELNEELLNKEKKIYKYYKCMMLSNFLCCGLFITGLIFMNIKCGSFDDIPMNDLPFYCPNKSYLESGSGS